MRENKSPSQQRLNCSVSSKPMTWCRDYKSRNPWRCTHTHKPKLETKIMRSKTLHGWGPQSFGLSPGVRHRSLEVRTNEATHVRFMIRLLTSLTHQNKQLWGWTMWKTEWTQVIARHTSQGKEDVSGIHVSVCKITWLFFTLSDRLLGILLMTAAWQVCSEVWEMSQHCRICLKRCQWESKTIVEIWDKCSFRLLRFSEKCL